MSKRKRDDDDDDVGGGDENNDTFEVCYNKTLSMNDIS
jgi:hypothetical protein